MENEEIYSKVLRAGRRTYFFDVRETKASDYYLTITESKSSPTMTELFFIKNTKYICIRRIFLNLKTFSLK